MDKQIYYISYNSKKMEGSEYNDGTAGADIKDNKVAPDTSYKYIWTVPDRAGPGPNDTNCVTWAYYSDVDAVKDPNTGLIGAMVICRKVSVYFRWSFDVIVYVSTRHMYKLDDVGISSNLIGSLSLANGKCSPSRRWIISGVKQWKA